MSATGEPFGASGVVRSFRNSLVEFGNNQLEEESLNGCSERIRVRSGTITASHNFWSVDNAPTRKQLGQYRFWLYVIAAPLRLVVGILGCATAIHFALLLPDGVHLPQNLRALLTGMRWVAGVVGCIHGLISVLGSIINFLLVANYMAFVSSVNVYKIEVFSTRVQTLVGWILGGILLLPVMGVSLQFCDTSLIDEENILALDTASAVCQTLSNTILVLGCSVVSVLVNTVLAIIGFQAFFLTYASVAYIRFAVASLTHGVAWFFLAEYQTNKSNEGYFLLDQDTLPQVTLYYVILILDGMLSTVVGLIPAFYSLFSSWKRSQILVAADAALSFCVSWFAVSASASCLWIIEIRSFFCKIPKFYVDQQSVLTNRLCKDSYAAWFLYCLIFLTAILSVTNTILAILSFFKYRPIEWMRGKKTRSR